jgi:hypothetical protein
MLGDHIRALKGDRWLHGIDLGDQRILFLDESPGLPPADRLRRVYRPEFTAGASKVELVVHREPAYPAKAVVARAWSRFMDPSVVAMFRDSEAFAAWCKIGRLPEATAAAPPPATPMAARAAAAAARRAPQPAPVRGTPARAAKVPARKGAARRSAAKRPAARRPTRRAAKAAARMAPARKAAGKKGPAKKAPAKKTPAKRPAARKKPRR